MKAYICIFIALIGLVVVSPISAQRYFPGQKGLQVAGGLTDGRKGFVVSAGYSVYNAHKGHWLFNAEYLQRNYPYRLSQSSISTDIPISQFTFESDYLLNIFDISKVFFANVGIGAQAGYETLNWGSNLLDDGATIRSSDRFIYGANVELETETYLSDRVVLLLGVKERCLFGSTTGRFHTVVFAGFKFILN